jgi:hypothetical protein
MAAASGVECLGRRVVLNPPSRRQNRGASSLSVLTSALLGRRMRPCPTAGMTAESPATRGTRVVHPLVDEFDFGAMCHSSPSSINWPEGDPMLIKIALGTPAWGTHSQVCDCTTPLPAPHSIDFWPRGSRSLSPWRSFVGSALAREEGLQALQACDGRHIATTSLPKPDSFFSCCDFSVSEARSTMELAHVVVECFSGPEDDNSSLGLDGDGSSQDDPM